MRSDEIRCVLQSGAVMLTPNLRSARQWRSRFGASDGDALPSNAILPWRAWTASLWQEALLRGIDDRVLLSDVQCASLWEEVIRAANPTTLRPMRSLVTLCMQAQTLVHRFRASDRLLVARHGETDDQSDAGQFRAWFRQFHELCQEQRLLPGAALDSALASDRVLAGLSDRVPCHWIVFGFHSLSPAQESFLTAAGHGGAAISRADASFASLGLGDREQGQLPPKLLRCDSDRDEYAMLAESLRSELLSEAGRSVAVIVPDLENSRNALERMLRETVAPEMRDVAAVRRLPPWEFSAGIPLASVPVVAEAIVLLRWIVSALPAPDVSSLLQSPYLAFQIEASRAAELDVSVLRAGARLRPEWAVEALAWRCRDEAPALSEQLFAWWRTVSETVRGRKGYGLWTETARLLLQKVGWPGTRERTSVEFQSVSRWEDLLDSLASLDLFDRFISFQEFVAKLQAMAGETLFAPENTGAPIQIMTVQEAAGSVFDRVWFLHADEARSNAKLAANPLLSYALQQSLAMPGVHAGQDAEQTLTTVRGMVESAAEVRFSYAAGSAEGAVRPSPVVEALPGLLRDSVSIAPPVTQEIGLEPYEADLPVPLAVAGPVNGGVSVLQSQAACAFRAFAEKRLFSTQIDSVDLGLDHRERGTLVHRVLESFWKAVKSQETLLQLKASGALEAELLRHIDTSLPSAGREDAWSDAYLHVQRERLRRLLLQWLHFEAQRPPFEVVFNEEKVPNVPIGPLHVDVRVDRVDRVAVDGEPGVVLVDYKTGSKDAKSWLDDRPEEPQLPLYAIAAGIENVRAIAFGIVKPGEKNLGMRGLPARSRLLVREKAGEDEDEFPAQMEEWRVTLERLAHEFASGDAKVSPKQYPVTCTYCAQRMLCRLNPEVLEAMADEEAMEVLD